MDQQRLDGIQACVFDAYGTLFDFNSAALAAGDELGDDAQRLSDLWRQKPVSYTHLDVYKRQSPQWWSGRALLPALRRVLV